MWRTNKGRGTGLEREVLEQESGAHCPKTWRRSRAVTSTNVRRKEVGRWGGGGGAFFSLQIQTRESDRPGGVRNELGFRSYPQNRQAAKQYMTGGDGSYKLSTNFSLLKHELFIPKFTLFAPKSQTFFLIPTFTNFSLRNYKLFIPKFTNLSLLSHKRFIFNSQTFRS